MTPTYPTMTPCGCPCCTVYGPRRKTPEQRKAELDKIRADIDAWAKTPAGQRALAEIQQELLLDQGKRQLGQALSELLAGGD